jgi:hypothetical protein
LVSLGEQVATRYVDAAQSTIEVDQTTMIADGSDSRMVIVAAVNLNVAVQN